MILSHGAQRSKEGVRNRHIAVDTIGLNHAIHVTANVSYREGTLEAFKNFYGSLSLVENVLRRFKKRI